MDSRIGVGIIIGITIGTTSLIWESENFTYSQKVFLTICFLFPPAQWILAILIYFFNTSNLSSLKFNLQSSSKNSNSQNKSEKPKISIDEQKQSIQILKDKGVLTESEYQEKIDIIDEQIKTEKVYKSAEYLNLKSLYENEVFTKEEFENKIEFLKTKEVVGSNQNQFNIVRDKLIGTRNDNIGTIEFWDDNSFVFKDEIRKKLSLKDLKIIKTYYKKGFSEDNRINSKIREKLEEVLNVKTSLKNSEFIELVIAEIEKTCDNTL